MHHRKCFKLVCPRYFRSSDVLDNLVLEVESRGVFTLNTHLLVTENLDPQTRNLIQNSEARSYPSFLASVVPREKLCFKLLLEENRRQQPDEMPIIEPSAVSCGINDTINNDAQCEKPLQHEETKSAQTTSCVLNSLTNCSWSWSKPCSLNTTVALSFRMRLPFSVVIQIWNRADWVKYRCHVVLEWRQPHFLHDIPSVRRTSSRTANRTYGQTTWVCLEQLLLHRLLQPRRRDVLS